MNKICPLLALLFLPKLLHTSESDFDTHPNSESVNGFESGHEPQSESDCHFDSDSDSDTDTDSEDDYSTPEEGAEDNSLSQVSHMVNATFR